MLIAGLVGALLGAFATVFALNFTGGEKRIERKLQHRPGQLIKSTDTVLQGESYFPKLATAGDAGAQVFTALPSGGSDSMLFVPDGDYGRREEHRSVRCLILFPIS